MVKGISSKKGSAKFNYFQPLNIFNTEIYHYDNRELHNLKEMSLAYIPGRIPGDIHRTSVALFISELLNNVIREEDVNRMLYDFIESSVITLDEMTAGISNFHLWFLVAFTDYAGIGPSHTTINDGYLTCSPVSSPRYGPHIRISLNHRAQRFLTVCYRCRPRRLVHCACPASSGQTFLNGF